MKKREDEAELVNYCKSKLFSQFYVIILIKRWYKVTYDTHRNLTKVTEVCKTYLTVTFLPNIFRCLSIFL